MQKTKMTILADLPARLTAENLTDYKNAGIHTYVMTEDFVPFNTDAYADGLRLCEEVGLEVFVRGYNRSNYFDGCNIDFNRFPCVKGFYLWDEPVRKSFEEIADKFVPWMEQSYPDKFWHINLYPSYAGKALGTEDDERGTAYENYINAFADIVLSKVKGRKSLSIDHYPLRHKTDGTGYYLSEAWLSDLYTAKLAAKRVNADFNCCIQVYDNDKVVRDIFSAADIRLQCYVSMAFGAEMFEYYQYGSYTTAEVDWRGMTERNGALRKPYFYVKEVNGELRKFEQDYLSYSWEGVAVVNGTRDNGCAAFARLDARLSRLPDSVERLTSENNLCLGVFDKDGKKAYIAVNFLEPTEQKSTRVRITLKSCDRVALYRNGEKETVCLNNGELEFVLAAGEGIFFAEAD